MNKESRDIRVVFSVLSIIIGLLAYKKFPSVAGYCLIFTNMFLWFFLLFLPLRLRPLFKVWMKASRVLGAVNTQILLGIVFSLIIIPLGAVMRAAGKDPMEREKKRQGATGSNAG